MTLCGYPICDEWHWCVYCALAGKPPNHSVIYRDVYLKGEFVTRYPACEEHRDREVPPAGVVEPWLT